eukprot:TRINITY_DN49462_c0_g1_i1.p1 TRINITY_DN49462_c0_g1~~TRINITY_DN49462_c0_g1_i1.p1  ORF type:complete len:116 (-),score=27.28 TRINITY_DN49462_c0_g1_i1:291-638(-)
MTSYEELPWQKDRLEERKELFKCMDNNGNFYVSLAEVDAVLTRDYTFGDLEMEYVNSCMLHAFNLAKDFGGEDRSCGADYVEHREFRIFLEMFVKKISKCEEDQIDGELDEPFNY